MARVSGDSEVRMEGILRMHIDLDPDESERLSVAEGVDIYPTELFTTVHAGSWEAGTVEVKGRVYRSDGTLGARSRSVMYTGPLDEFFEGPEWLAPLVQKEIDKSLRGATGRGQSSLAREVAELIDARLREVLTLEEQQRKVKADVAQLGWEDA